MTSASLNSAEILELVLALGADVPLVIPVALFVLAAVALVDLVVVARRKLRGERKGGDQAHAASRVRTVRNSIFLS